MTTPFTRGAEDLVEVGWLKRTRRLHIPIPWRQTGFDSGGSAAIGRLENETDDSQGVCRSAPASAVLDRFAPSPAHSLPKVLGTVREARARRAAAV
jgi:hypothetical protein